jgi:hypothetical protein
MGYVVTDIKTDLGNSENDSVSLLLKELVHEIKTAEVPPAILELAEKLQQCFDASEAKSAVKKD